MINYQLVINYQTFFYFSCFSRSFLCYAYYLIICHGFAFSTNCLYILKSTSPFPPPKKKFNIFIFFFFEVWPHFSEKGRICLIIFASLRMSVRLSFYTRLSPLSFTDPNLEVVLGEQFFVPNVALLLNQIHYWKPYFIFVLFSVKFDQRL